MSLGSLARWSSVLYGVVRLANTASDIEIPMSAIVTTIICLFLLLQFEYTNGGVIAALAVLETPIKSQDESSCMTRSDVARVESGDARQSSSLRQQVFKRVMEFLGYGIVSFAGVYFLSHLGYTEMNFQTIICCLFYYIIGSIGRIVTNPPKSNAVTGQRSVAHRHLQSQRGFRSSFMGIEFFLVYVGLTVLVMTLITNFAAEPSFPVYIVSKLSLGLLLTNLHTAWIHTVISKPTSKACWHRIPGWREWLGVIPVASLDILLPDFVHYSTKTFLVSVQGIMSTAAIDWGYEEISSSLESFERIAIDIIPILSCSLAAILTNAIYIRVAASMLPGDDQPVVHFDCRGSASNEKYCLGILDAIRTIKMQNWHRYLSIVWEVAVYEYLWASFSVIVIGVQIHYLAPCAVVDLIVLFAQHL